MKKANLMGYGGAGSSASRAAAQAFEVHHESTRIREEAVPHCKIIRAMAPSA